jgi:hypothetical protein
MTEGLGRRARWTSMLLAVPGAAALFGAATSWALHAAPSNGTLTPSPTPTRTQQPADGGVLAAQHSATANRQELSRLERQLARLRAQVAALGASTPAGPTVQRGTLSATSTGPAAPTTQPPAPIATASASAPAAPPTTSAPPPAQTSTGASGAAK